MAQIIAIGIYTRSTYERDAYLRKVYWSEPSLAGAYLSRAVQEGKNNSDEKIIVTTFDDLHVKDGVDKYFVMEVIESHQLPPHECFIEIKL